MLLISDFLRYWLHRAFQWSNADVAFPMRCIIHRTSSIGSTWVAFTPARRRCNTLWILCPSCSSACRKPYWRSTFTFYAINGFFQHSNCAVRLGPLNYIVSGPELHRWHHSKLPSESDTNFGNNLIVWDSLFGTRFLPRDREVGPLGLLNRSYPTGFAAQMTTPFMRGLERS